ncbi:hypothetical protein HO173_011547 [Letharia columbiana]|uniref:Uncharacterized protein n=1 Tax=Letharia columbiana TaxID=112416 RepID=A0A8H6FJ74_9LECA|nr:uncharacterized protein HO173_011547 [Letharia columbiana]KAF6229507.1 hypothetical protein HO173_011547 [Letharia columbiana]
MAVICEATIDGFTGTQILHDILHIQFGCFELDMIGPLRSYTPPKLRAFNGFRNIVVEVLLEDEYDTGMQEVIAGFERVKQGIKDAMEPTLGLLRLATSNTKFTLMSIHASTCQQFSEPRLSN